MATYTGGPILESVVSVNISSSIPGSSDLDIGLNTTSAQYAEVVWYGIGGSGIVLRHTTSNGTILSLGSLAGDMTSKLHLGPSSSLKLYNPGGGSVDAVGYAVMFLYTKPA